MLPVRLGLAVLLVLCRSLSATAAGASQCERLSSLRLPNTTLRSRTIPAGGFTRPADAPRSDPSFFTAFQTLPAFCRVQGIVTPARDSHIEFEVWLPESGWNGKYVGAGNGGYSGAINVYRLAEAVNAGFVGSATDAGHKGTSADARWSQGHPAQVVDFHYRAIHETAEKTKAIVRAFYREPLTASFFNSCSNGGRQAIVEAARYPADYDGILAGAPAFSWTFGPDGNPSASDLREFAARGGKLILYHGALDGPAPTISYYEHLRARLSAAAVDAFARLYVVPDMGHCGGGPVPDFGLRIERGVDADHSMWRALERWVESAAAPGAIVAAKYTVDGDRASGIVRTRPICAYPAEAKRAGVGNADAAEAYACVVAVPSVHRR